MRAIVITRPGGPEVLELREVADPVPGPEELLVAVRASAMNRADVLQRRGRYPAPPGVPPDIPGLEFAGEVLACGPRAALFAPGDRVMGILGGGGHAERVVLHERTALRVPERLSWVEAAALPEAFLTAFDALALQAGLAAGETVLVPAAASGVGTAALQLARASGARAIALSRAPEKRARLAAFGPAAVLDGTSATLAAEIRAAAPHGVDVVLDLVGAPLWPVYLDVLAPRARVVVVGTLGGSETALDLGRLMRLRATVVGTVLRSRPLEEKIAVTRAFARRMGPFVESGALAAVVDRVLPLAAAAEAHRAMEANANLGKIVLRVDAAPLA